jgi:Leucine-rich repeat (LRR) protein
MRKALFLALLALLAAFPLRGAIPTSERNALQLLYASTGGDNWRDRANWLGAPGTECTWYGVECNAEGTHIVSLSLSDNNLSGPLPGELGNLPYLQYLRLDFNLLTGPIPDSLGTLTALEVLDLAGNQRQNLSMTKRPDGPGSLAASQSRRTT